jgi:hypothetical protein
MVEFPSLEDRARAGVRWQPERIPERRRRHRRSRRKRRLPVGRLRCHQSADSQATKPSRPQESCRARRVCVLKRPGTSGIRGNSG